jgi:hypothetical protein
MPSSTWPHASHEPRRLVRLWIGVLAGPLLFLALLETNYVLTYVACERRIEWPVHAASAVAFVLVGLAGLSAWRTASTVATDIESTDPGTTRDARVRFMALGGAVLCLGFMLVIIAMEIPAVVLTPCG